MSKIFNLNKSKSKLIEKEREIIEVKEKPKREGDYMGYIRHYIPANKEWDNSVYTYNKNAIKLLPSLDDIIISFIRSYFNMFNRKLERKIKLPFLKTWRKRLSIRNIWVSRCELKHSNDKVIITLYIYNRRYKYLFNKILNIIYKKKKIINRSRNRNRIRNISRSISFIKKSFIQNINILKQRLKWSYMLVYKKIKVKHANFNENWWKNVRKTYFTLFIKKYCRREILYIKYKQVMLFNKFKFNDMYISPIKNLLCKIYNKEIEFNLVTLKNIHLNSDILAQVLISKIRNKKNRALRVLKASVRNIKTPILNNRTILRRESVELIDVQNLIINDFIVKPKSNNYYWDKILNNKLYYNDNNIDIQNTILNSIKFKTVSGIRIKASGRITRRIIAERATYKLKSVGTLKNIDSSYKGLPSIMVRGNKKSNIQYTNLNSRTRIGSFGLKSWISGY